jgi:hypothetical protein
MTETLHARWLAGLITLALIASCGGPRRSAHAVDMSVKGAVADSSDDVLAVGETLVDLSTLPVEKRMALQAAQIETALALWKADYPAEAVAHFDAALGAAPKSLMLGFDALGYDPSAVQALRDAAAKGEAAEKSADAITALQTQLTSAVMAPNARLADTISFLMKTCVTEYRAAVGASELIDAGGYARAWGRAKTAHALIAARVDTPDHPNADALLQSQLLVRLWPREGPLPGSLPAPLSMIDSQAARVDLEAASLGD